MTKQHRFSIGERRARLGRRHALVEPAASVADAAEAMVVLHATDPASVYLSALARLAEPSLDAVEHALYEDRTVVRILAMRRTLFVVPVRYLGVVEQSSSVDVAARLRRQLEGALASNGIADPARWLLEAHRELEAVLAVGGAQARALTRQSSALATKLVIQPGTKNEVILGATSRVLMLLAAEGYLIRGQPSGDWRGRQYEWHCRDRWIEGAPDEIDPDRASSELVHRWLRTFGPATFDDLKWWTGWRVDPLREALAGLDVTEVDLDGVAGLVLTTDLEPTPEPDPWAALLPALDPTPMGWKERHWYLGIHRPQLFDRSGNIGPTIWVDGRIVGGWGQRPDGRVVTRLLEDVGTDHHALIDAKAGELQALVGETVVKPSFPTPLQREIYQNTS